MKYIIKRCKNPLCLKLIYPYQYNGTYYCCADCKEDAENWVGNDIKKDFTNTRIDNNIYYLHKLYPQTTLIIEDEWWERVNNKIKELS